jgi:excisionase family DNA binding protein
MSERILYRVSETADLLGCSKSMAYELIAAGEIPSVKLAGMLRVPADALRRLIQEKLAAAGAGDVGEMDGSD